MNTAITPRFTVPTHTPTARRRSPMRRFFGVVGRAQRACANIERGLANVLLGQHLRSAPMASRHRGNVWVRLVAMSRERSRRRELAYLFVRIPVGIATFVIAIVALAAPLAVTWAPIEARRVDDFGNWSGVTELHDLLSSPWSWGLIPLGLGLLVISIHLLNGLAARCGRWSAGWLEIDRQTAVQLFG